MGNLTLLSLVSIISWSRNPKLTPQNFIAQRRSPRKTERRPVFVLNIELPPRSLDICLEPTKASVQFEVKKLNVASWIDLTIGLFTE
jgi:hypothetical protein